jgi:hypothetical protein
MNCRLCLLSPGDEAEPQEQCVTRRSLVTSISRRARSEKLRTKCEVEILITPDTLGGRLLVMADRVKVRLRGSE